MLSPTHATRIVKGGGGSARRAGEAKTVRPKNRLSSSRSRRETRAGFFMMVRFLKIHGAIGHHNLPCGVAGVERFHGGGSLLDERVFDDAVLAGPDSELHAHIVPIAGGRLDLAKRRFVKNNGAELRLDTFGNGLNGLDDSALINFRGNLDVHISEYAAMGKAADIDDVPVRDENFLVVKISDLGEAQADAFDAANNAVH